MIKFWCTARVRLWHIADVSGGALGAGRFHRFRSVELMNEARAMRKLGL
jgi:hypothetical protein